MNWFIKTLTSSLGRKLVMSLTGLFLCLFLVVHLAGNFQLFKDDGGLAFNTYTKFMTHNPLIKTISYVLYAFILIHAIQALLLYGKNKKARPQGYYNTKPEANSTWSSRNMGILGTVLFVFLVIHFSDFWAEYKFGEIPYKSYYEVEYDNEKIYFNSYGESNKGLDSLLNLEKARFQAESSKPGFKPESFEPKFAIGKSERISVKDLYAEVKLAFQQPLYVIFYLLAMLALSYHLVHGFQSAWQSLGVHHRKYVPVIKTFGWLFSVIIPASFAAMPVFFLMEYINNNGILDWTRFF